MDPQSIEIIDAVLNAVVTFTALYFEAILATLIFLLGYSLLRTGLEKLPPSGGRTSLDYAKSIGPGAAFVLVAITIFAGQDALLLALFLLILTVGAGFGFVAIGYRLLIQGIYQAEDRETIWTDGVTLIGRAGPGIVLTLVGIFLIANVLLSAPANFREYSSERLNARVELGESVDARLTELLTLLLDRNDETAVAADLAEATGDTALAD